MARLGYVPSNAARMMRSNRSGLIGLITGAISQNPDPNEPHGLPDLYIVQGIQKPGWPVYGNENHGQYNLCLSGNAFQD